MSSFQFVLNSGATVKDLDTDYGVRVTMWQGGGMPPLDNINLNYALGDGAIFQRTIARPRTITLVCMAPHASIAAMHSIRKKINADINRDALNSGTFTLRYSGAGATTIDIPVRYAGGLELSDGDGLLNKPFQIRLLAVNPFWQGSALQTVSMATSATLSNATWILQSTSGVWAGFNGTNGPAESPNAIVTDSSGNVWVATSAGVYKNSSGTWTKYATNATVRDLCVGTDGTTIYAAGDFTTINSVSVSYVAKCVSGTWSNPASTALTHVAYGVSAGPNYLWATVDDSTNGNSLYRCAYGGAWATGLTNNLTKSGRAIAHYASDTQVYFAAIYNTSTTASIWGYNTTLSLLVDYGDLGGTAVATCIAYYSGQLLIGGTFSSIGGASATNIALYNGGWAALGAGLNNTVNGVAYDGTTVYAVGAFTDTGYPYFAKYTSGAWASGGITLPEAGSAIGLSGTKLTVGTASPGTAPTSAGTAGTTSIVNTSTRLAYPTIAITASGTTTLQSIVNTYTGAQLLFNYAMGAGEVITITTAPGARSVVSSSAGNILGQLLSGSNLSTFGVSPGTHNYTIQATDGTKITASFAYYYTYWSVDDVAV